MFGHASPNFRDMRHSHSCTVRTAKRIAETLYLYKSYEIFQHVPFRKDQLGLKQRQGCSRHNGTQTSAPFVQCPHCSSGRLKTCFSAERLWSSLHFQLVYTSGSRDGFRWVGSFELEVRCHMHGVFSWQEEMYNSLASCSPKRYLAYLGTNSSDVWQQTRFACLWEILGMDSQLQICLPCKPD